MTHNTPFSTWHVPRRLFAGVCLLLGIAVAMAAPFDRWMAYTQPDGTVVRIHGQGDEFSAQFEAEDGFTVLFDTARKAYCYASLDASGALVSTGVQVGGSNSAPAGLTPGLRSSDSKRRESAAQRYQKWDAGMQISSRWEALKETARQHYTPRDPNGPQSAPPPFTTVGLKVGLTMLIDFSDVPSSIPQTDIVSYLNGDGYTGYGNNGSVKQYFYDNSDGLLTYSNVVTIYIRAPQPKSYYADVTKGAGTQANLLIKDCVEVMKALPNYQTEILPMFDALTTDAQNQVIAFNVFYAGDDGGVWSMGLWPHSWALVEVGPQELSPGGKKLWRYQVTNIGAQLSIGTFAHENGHMLCGYPDLYDYDYDSVGGAGDFCLMGYGGFDKNPVQISAYLKRASGWATITEVNSTSSLLATASSEGENFNHFYRYQKPGVSTEYYLIENRQLNGRDARMPGAGLAIWHCDELGDRDNQSLAYNSSHANFEVTLVQADNRWDLQNARNAGDNVDLWYSGNTAPGYPGDFSDDSQPSARWWDGTRSGLMVADISSQAVNMTLRLGFGMPLKVASTEVGGGNGNGIIDPNECNQLTIAIYNDSDLSMTGISARLSSSTPGVIIAQRNSNYQDLLPHGTNVNLTPFQVSTAPWFICGTPIHFTLSLTTEQGNGAAQFQLQTGFIGEALEFSNLVPVSIPDNNLDGVDSYITVSNLVGAVQKVTVSLHIPHTWAGDLKLQLVSPGGITNTLSEYHGFGGNNYGLSCQARTVFDDDATNDIAGALAPFLGTFTPDEPLSVYQGLSGTNLNGRWALHVVDALQLDVGSIMCWSLNLTMPACDDGLGECPGSDLGVSATAAPNPCIIGQPLTYSISVTNRGPSTAKTVILSHVLPPGAIVNGLTPSQGSASQAGGVVTCNFGPIGALGSATLVVRVTPTVPGMATSSVTVSSEQADHSLSDNVVTLKTQVNPPTADLALGLNAVPSAVVLGEPVVLTVAVTNNGPSSASPVLVTNVLPIGLSLTSSTISQGSISTPASSVVVCSFGTLTNGGRASATLHLASSKEGQLYIQSRAVANQFDPISANSSAAALISVGPAAELALGIIDSPDPVLVDGNFTWLAAITNRGPSDASGVMFTLNLPANATVVSSSSSRGTLTLQGNVLTCDIGAMSKGTVETVTVQMRSSSAGVLNGAGNVAGNEADLNNANNSVAVTTTVSLPFVEVVPAGATLIAETVVDGAVDAGETNTMILRLKNVGNVTTTNLIARLLASGGITPLGATEQHYGVLAPSGWPVGKAFTFVANGANGAEAVATLELRDGGSTNFVTFTFKLPNVYWFGNNGAINIPALGQATPYPSTISVSGVTGLVSKVTATVSNLTHTYPKDISMQVAAPSGSSALIMSHAGRPNPSAVTLTFDDSAAAALPASVQVTSGTWKPSNYAPSPAFPAPAPGQYAGALSIFNGLNPNGNWSLFAIDDASGDQGIINQGWSLSIVTITPVNQVADLSIAGAAAPTPALAGSQLEYTFTVTNAGPDTANAVTVTNSIPPNAVFVSADSSQGFASASGNTLVTDLGSLPAGGVATVHMIVIPGAGAAGGISCSAAVTANETDLNQVKNVVTVGATVGLPAVDIAISQSASASTVVEGQDVSLSLTVSNLGSGLALETVVTNPIPAGMTFVSVSASRGSASLIGAAVVCQFGDLAGGEQAEAQITLKAVAAGQSGNAATAKTKSMDQVPANNSTVLPITIMAPAPVIEIAGKYLTSESLTPPNGTVQNGETVTLQVGLVNTGNAAAGNITATLAPVSGIVVNGAATQSYGAIPVGSPAVYRAFSLTASGAPGAVVAAQLLVQNNGVGVAAFPIEFALPGVSTYANTSLISIPDTGSSMPYPSSIVVTNAKGYVKSATVSLNGVAHSFPEDLTIVVVAPNGRSVTLMAHAGGAHGLAGVNLTFDDAAGAALPENAQITAGNWKPTSFGTVTSLPAPAPPAPYGATLAACSGSLANGTWSLYVLDDTTGDGGAISNGWSISIETLDVVNTVADLAVTLSSTPVSLFAGDRCTNRITVANSGPGAAEFVAITNILPAGAIVEASSASAGTVDPDSGLWNLGLLGNGAMAECSIVFRLTTAGSFVSSATAGAWAYEFNLANNTQQTAIDVAPVSTPPSIAISVTNGVCQLLLSGQAGLTYVTESSGNLQIWSPISTNVIPDIGIVKVVDPEPATLQSKFYRMRRLNP